MIRQRKLLIGIGSMTRCLPTGEGYVLVDVFSLPLGSHSLRNQMIGLWVWLSGRMFAYYVLQPRFNSTMQKQK